ncbi:MAG TPA: HAD hydrolase-like protein [Thermoanaerobaculia bacterium]|nr:HAD hydrolase-like protein [Thermoanaerobaculia bacterium]
MPRLVLFDIDGTLISDNGAARDAYGKALIEVYKFSGPLTPYDFSGLTDGQITHMVLGEAGFAAEEIDERLDALWTQYLHGLAENVSEERIKVLAGVEELLERLTGMPELTLGLVTGNIERGARIKLAPTSLSRYFAFGAFGSDSRDRLQLPPIAIERASRLSGRSYSGRDVVIIGDSIFDIRCGVPHGATTIGVTTGRTSRETLAREKPDHLFDSLEPTEELVAAITGNQ